MKTNKKLKIEDLKIQSFVTKIDKSASQTVLGGIKTVPLVCKCTGCDSGCGIVPPNDY